MATSAASFPSTALRELHTVTSSPIAIPRRHMLTRLAAVGWTAVLAGCAGAQAGQDDRRQGGAGGKENLDAKIMTFAMNLEYLEAEYYTRGAYGHGLAEHPDVNGVGSPADVRGGRKVEFSRKQFQDHAEELSYNEAAHVRFYRKQLGSAAPANPPIDFQAGFRAAGKAAGLGDNFDPFADEISFFLGGMLFEDVGVTAYHGAAPLITSKQVLDAATGILAVEAYHMGMARTIIYAAGEQARENANKVSKARDTLDGGRGADQGVELDGKANIVPNDPNGIAFKRTPRRVLDIVYLQPGAMRGGFYPQGMNGDFTGLL